MKESEVTTPKVITSCLTLRKLTLKSELGYGDNKHLTVADVIRVGRTVDLIWAYYNLSMISFMPDVLKQLGLNDEDFINKPGKDTDKGDEVIKRFETTSLETNLKEDKSKLIERFDRGRTRANQRLNTKIRNARNPSETSTKSGD